MERLTYHRDAREEIKQAACFYESCTEGLGDRYLVAVESAIERLVSDPFRNRILRGKFRRCLVKGFPYGVIYAVNDEEIYIAAVMHLKRKPGYWIGRSFEK